MLDDRAILHSILDNTPNVISLKDREGRYAVVNDNMEKMLGLSRAAIVGRTDDDIFPPDIARAIRDADLRATHLHARISVEERLRVKGRDRIFLSHKFPVFDDSGETAFVCSISREITERKRSERELFFFKYLIERSREPFHIISPAAGFRFVYVNEAACRHFQRSREELLALSVPDYDPLFDRTKCEAALEELRQLGSLHFESRHRRADGTEVPVELWVNYIEYEGQELLAGWFHDISERKNAEKALRDSQERYALLNRATNDVIWDWDMITGVVEWNDMVEAAFGLKKEDIGDSLHDWYDRIHAEDRERVRQGLEDAITRGAETWTDEYRFHCRDDWKTFFDRGFIVRESGGKAKRMIGSMLDLTERRMMEEALLQSESQFRQLTEALPQLVWVARPDGHLEYFNSRWYEYTGLIGEDSRGEMWSRSLHPDDYQRTLDRWDYSLRTGESYEIEYRIRRGADGSYLWFLGRGLPLRDREGEIVRWIGTCTDIDHQKQTEEELRKALDELTRTNRELEQFAYVASHDLQEPLRMVASYVQILAKKYQGQLDDKADSYIRFAVEGATRMQQLIEDLLTFYRIGRSGAFMAVDMNGVFAAATAEVAEQAEQTGAEVTSDLLPTVSGDRGQLELLLQHLIGNALKYRRHDEPPRVHVSAKAANGEWEFSVRDNGIGIEPQYFGRIFLIFQRLHSRDRYPGTGIGLAMCRKIVERHHGRIWVDSEEGEGSTFHFTIPVEQDAQEPLRQTPERDEQPTTGG